MNGWNSSRGMQSRESWGRLQLAGMPHATIGCRPLGRQYHDEAAAPLRRHALAAESKGRQAHPFSRHNNWRGGDSVAAVDDGECYHRKYARSFRVFLAAIQDTRQRERPPSNERAGSHGSAEKKAMRSLYRFHRDEQMMAEDEEQLAGPTKQKAAPKSMRISAVA